MTPGEIVEIHREQRNHMMAEATALECGKRTHLTMIGGQMVDVLPKKRLIRDTGLRTFARLLRMMRI